VIQPKPSHEPDPWCSVRDYATSDATLANKSCGR